MSLAALGYYKDIPKFVKYEGWLILSTLFEAPNLFMMFKTHMRSFAVENNSKLTQSAQTVQTNHYAVSNNSSSDSDDRDSFYGLAEQENQPFTVKVIDFDARFSQVYQQRDCNRTYSNATAKLLDED
jgi:hypothetical protein